MQPSSPTVPNGNDENNTDTAQPAVTVFTNSPHLHPGEDNTQVSAPVEDSFQETGQVEEAAIYVPEVIVPSTPEPVIEKPQERVEYISSPEPLVFLPPTESPEADSSQSVVETETQPSETVEPVAAAPVEPLVETAPVNETPMQSIPSAPNILIGRGGSIDGMRQQQFTQPSVVSPVSGSVSEMVEPIASTFAASQAPALAASRSPRRKRKMFVILAVVLVSMLALGGTAGAYFMMVLPNKPENVLKRALVNAAQQQHVGYDGQVETSGNGLAVKVAFKGQSDLQANAHQVQMNVTAMGVTVPIEARLVEKNGYVKFNDLSTLSGLAQQYTGAEGAEIKALFDKVSGKWLLIDSTLFAQANLSCVLEPVQAPTEQDLQLLLTAYEAQPFAASTVITEEDIDGQTNIKYSFDVDNALLQKYTDSVSEASFVKSLDGCADTAAQSATSASGEKIEVKGVTKVQLWINKAEKRIARIATDISEEGQIAKFDTKLTYDKVAIEKPANATPIAELFMALGPEKRIIAGLSPPSAMPLIAKAQDTERANDIQATHAQIESYFAANQKYPTLANLNSESWVSVNLTGLSVQYFTDPESATSKYVAQPTIAAYSYSPTTADGRVCNNTFRPCTKYTLTATTSTGPYVKESLN